ncbi:MAG TPA: apolipoprotein N-acyltransferase [Pyrinomonadaceae bacterium]|jgi:apolipoprotein N-acyltransferase
MKKFARLRKNLLHPASAGLAALSALLLMLAFPGFEFWFLAWFALIPLFFAVEREKDSVVKSFLTGWTFGVVFFFGTCWWLTFAPINYASLPAPLVYFFLFSACAVVGILPGIFAALFSILLKKIGSYAILLAPFLWTCTEFLRMLLTGNNWNAIGYSQAFKTGTIQLASLGGVYLVGFLVVLCNAYLTFLLTKVAFSANAESRMKRRDWIAAAGIFFVMALLFSAGEFSNSKKLPAANDYVVAVQPNVPMSGLTIEKYRQLLERHIQLAENALKQRATDSGQRTTIIFPESPMIFQYGRDADLRELLRQFALRNNASVLFNSAEETRDGKQVLNSAVMINERGEKIGQYDKIHLLPFGEYMPLPESIASEMPAFVGNFQFGERYDLLPFGDASGGVMICFESHFGELSREYARRGADVLVEMTNDGYLGNTPVLRQHLANTVFRAVETNLPVLRVTNVGITAYINERGEVLDAADVYGEATRVWTVSKAGGAETIYVKYGDWFAWACSILSLALIIFSLISAPRRHEAEAQK